MFLSMAKPIVARKNPDRSSGMDGKCRLLHPAEPMPKRPPIDEDSSKTVEVDDEDSIKTGAFVKPAPTLPQAPADENPGATAFVRVDAPGEPAADENPGATAFVRLDGALPAGPAG